jgi:ribosome maturation factor RimP
MTEQEQREKSIINEVWNLIEPVVRAEGMELIEVEYRREPHGWVLRLFIDQEHGISVDDCARVSDVVGDLLDVADPISNQYHLEVSSPGLNRPLRKWQHFADHLGKIIEVKTSLPLDNRRRFKGRLLSAGPEEISMDCDGQVYEVPLPTVERARLRYFDSLP